MICFALRRCVPTSLQAPELTLVKVGCLSFNIWWFKWEGTPKCSSFTIKPWQDEITHWERENFPSYQKTWGSSNSQGSLPLSLHFILPIYMLKPLLKTPIYQGDRVSQGFLLSATLPRANSNKSTEAQGPLPLAAVYLLKQIFWPFWPAHPKLSRHSVLEGFSGEMHTNLCL